VVYVLNTFAASFGFLLAPSRVLRAFRHGIRQSSLYRKPDDYEALLSLSVQQLRKKLGIAARGLAVAPRRLHEDAMRALRTTPAPPLAE
jgi:hypothetical protein